MSAIAEAFAGAASGTFGSLFSGLTGMRNTDKTNQANKDIAADTNAVNKAIADQNLAFQQQTLDYQKALQQQIFEREDTSYQRTVNDMRAAGLSPLSMQQANGAGEAIAVTAPQNGYQAQTGTPMQAYTPNFDFSSIGQALEFYADQKLKHDELQNQSDMAQAQASLMRAQAAKEWTSAAYQDRILAAQLKKLGLENTGLSLSNDNFSARANAELNLMSAQAKNLGAQTTMLNWQDKNAARDWEYNNHFGLFSGQSQEERIASILASQGEFNPKEYGLFARELVKRLEVNHTLDVLDSLGVDLPGVTGAVKTGVGVVKSIFSLGKKKKGKK